MKKEISSLKKSLEKRIDAEDRKIESSENFSLKILSTIGDVCKKVLKLEKEIEKLKNDFKQHRRK